MANNLKANEEEWDGLEEEDADDQNWEDWKANEEEEEDDDDFDSYMLCLFCESKYNSSDAFFQHCSSSHNFDFQGIRKSLGLDFYASFKLINYVRSQVAHNRCWACGISFQSKKDLHDHLHEIVSFDETRLPWDDEKYLNPFMQEDPLLYSFTEDDECEDDFNKSADKEELMRVLSTFEMINVDYENDLEMFPSDFSSLENGLKEVVASAPDSNLGTEIPLEKVMLGSCNTNNAGLSGTKIKDLQLRVSSLKIVENEIIKVNKSYFGSYGSFGIHREMISDKVRTDAYRRAIVDNPSLLKGAVVLDVGCGTGILSLFAAQAGASRVIAVEASEKMAAVATQIAKDNGLLWSGSPNEYKNHDTGVIKVVHGMVEDLISSGNIQRQSVDVLLSEWMGYCLLYETMLSSVLTARDQWLKPGGAILPDTTTMFVAGFGKGATSIPFWENVYGFSMSCVGKELVEDASRVPIVDVVDDQDIVTNAVVLQAFDLVTMKPEEMDFTATVELEPKLDVSPNYTDSAPRTTWCYGVVLWFETGFTSRFCHEMPTVLSTSPYTPKTHWSQTIFTFREAIAIASGKPNVGELAAVGTQACPAVKMHSRISIARALEHRSIDIAIETTAIGYDGRKRNWPVQIFNLC